MAAWKLAARKLGGLAAKSLGFTLAEVLIPKRMRGIINGVSNSRMSEIKEPCRLNKKSVAFTLAEVLITLAIIGVVAALTIPTVVAKYQQKQYYTQFMKTYNTLSNAFAMAQADYGDYRNWEHEDDKDFINKYMAPYLKIAKICDSYTDCDITDDMDINWLNHSTAGYGNTPELYSELFDSDIVVLSDATLLKFYIPSYRIMITFDTNGIKGPNTYGRDIFSVDYTNVGDICKLGTWEMFYDHEMVPSNTLMDEMLNGECTTDVESYGYSCATRLLLEGKMNY